MALRLDTRPWAGPQKAAALARALTDSANSSRTNACVSGIGRDETLAFARDEFRYVFARIRLRPLLDVSYGSGAPFFAISATRPVYLRYRKIVASQRTNVEGQGTKSLRSSPLRGVVSREACNKPIG
jgi:hypothetical protein